ncbi:MAG: hypothetical protein RL375_507, partial [Pseudomonadota bacterium]
MAHHDATRPRHAPGPLIGWSDMRSTRSWSGHRTARWLAAAAALALAAGCAQPAADTGTVPVQAGAATGLTPGMQKIRHLVVIYAENRSFDHLYGLFPGADGVANASPESMRQIDHDGKPLRELLVLDARGQPDPR